MSTNYHFRVTFFHSTGRMTVSTTDSKQRTNRKSYTGKTAAQAEEFFQHVRSLGHTAELINK